MTIEYLILITPPGPDPTELQPPQDLTLLNYNLNIDMSDSFHWNVKMIFLYLVTEYTNADNAVNQVVGAH